jgi:hypothetical protein
MAPGENELRKKKLEHPKEEIHGIADLQSDIHSSHAH